MFEECLKGLLKDELQIVIINYYFCVLRRDVSSVGSERLLDRQEVTGSIPVRPTHLNES
jgi:hypothetical protein